MRPIQWLRARTSGGSELKLPSFPQFLLILLEIVIIMVLIQLDRMGAIGGLEYGVGLLGFVIFFAFLTKTARS